MRIGSGGEQRFAAGSLHRIEREWSGATEVALRFPMRARVTSRSNDAAAIERGPLVYALQIGEEWTRVSADKPHRELPHADFEVRPSTPWNYGLVVDDRHLDATARFEERPVGERPFPRTVPPSSRRRAAVASRTGRSFAAGRASCPRPTPPGRIPIGR